MTAFVPTNSGVLLRGEDIDAASRLLERMFPGRQGTLAMFVFGTNRVPLPESFFDPNKAEPWLKKVVSDLAIVLAKENVYTWGLTGSKVDQLDVVKDPRITEIRKKLESALSAMPWVQELRQKRIDIIEQAKQQDQYNV